ncbi:unnamed protein product [Prunus armeniaca]
METVSLSKTQLDQQVRIGTTLSSPLRTEFIAFLCAQAEVFAWSYNDMPNIPHDVISHQLNISPNFKPIW